MSIAKAWREDPEGRRRWGEKPREGNLRDALQRVAESVRGKRVTFRVGTLVNKAPPKNYRDPLEDLPVVDVDAGARGTTVTVMVDGRDIVELDDGRAVLARVGKDCVLLGWWQRLIDRVWHRRTFD